MIRSPIVTDGVMRGPTPTVTSAILSSFFFALDTSGRSSSSSITPLGVNAVPGRAWAAGRAGAGGHPGPPRRYQPVPAAAQVWQGFPRASASGPLGRAAGTSIVTMNGKFREIDALMFC